MMYDASVSIDFDSDKKVFFLSMPIFVSEEELPDSIKKYVEARRNQFFNPFKTRFEIEGKQRVNLVQELPFRWGFQPGFREQIHAFRKLSTHSSQILSEIAIEEKLEQALNVFELAR